MSNPSMQCNSYVVKVASRCNLNCSYCYMYNKGDDSWRGQPKVMSEETIVHYLNRVREHQLEFSEPKRTFFSFHGGEPLLAGIDRLQFFVDKAREILADTGSIPHFAIQTNGILVTDEVCEFFEKNDIGVGVSLDGPKEVNDTHRVYHNGKGSYDDVMKGVERLKANAKINARLGFLLVIDRTSDPIEMYDFVRDLESVDLLIPDCTHDDPGEGVGGEGTPIADWLIPIFDRWFVDSNRPRIRFFNGIVDGVLGGDPGVDTFGERNNTLLVVETNGDFEPVDTLKICGQGFTKVGANVRNTSITEALQTDLASLYYHSNTQLAPKCQECPIRRVCGGGHLPHRYSKENGFQNPSVYCSDLMKLITHVQNRVLETIPPEILSKTKVTPITYDEVKAKMDNWIPPLSSMPQFSPAN